MNHIMLENERVRLTPLRPEDIDALWEVSKENPGLLQYSPSDISTRYKLRAYIETAINHRQAYTIYDKQQEEIAGCTSYGNISEDNKRAEIGWTWIGEKFQGSGLNDQVKSLMLEYAFDVAGMKRVEFKIDARNVRSRKAVEKLGAQYEGCLRSHTVMQDGFRRDTVYYAILENEWKEQDIK